MKKYKLIKEYDGSPKLGTIIVETMIIGNNPKFRTFTISGHDKNCDMGKFRLDNPEISPEFWEEVVEYPIGTKAEDNRINKTFTKEVDGWYTSSKTGHTDKSISNANHIEILNKVVKKDYEILSLINPLKNNCEILENLENGYSFEYKLNKFPHLQIKSVKRLSDNTIFTVGDKLETGTIKQFYIPNDVQKEVTIYVTKDDEDTYLSEAKHIKKPLFKTFDNVDIYEGDDLFWLHKKSNTIGKYVWNNFKSSLNDDKWLFFSTKQAAQDYINSKKVLFTTEDGVDIKKGDKSYYLSKTNHSITEGTFYGGGEHNGWYFSTKELAETYILHRKPCLSMQDLKSTGCLNEKQWFAILDLVKHKSKL